ncbi:hypothetical protein T4B_2752 [Trichinella pseudospiralis]|uniref:Uncharacterized protein n=2 Tax=Trichinella pseudospiralis TaxID=6337 RepID=A0A0V1FSZ3_TRIPS|nr:hypothetical protein T4E_9732 [Trichinella pseudospiralis]KRY89133.1 hypothetical protein T4D_6632 [Trichinella pseudospiralis]KRZ33763.1 hypothetical protein T4B_2752 [Trichinella pseudospiralis]
MPFDLCIMGVVTVRTKFILPEAVVVVSSSPSGSFDVQQTRFPNDTKPGNVVSALLFLFINRRIASNARYLFFACLTISSTKLNAKHQLN